MSTSFEIRITEGTEVEVRRATAEDHEAILAMYETFEPRGGILGLPPLDNPEHWLASLAAYPNFVVFVDARLAGHGVLCPENDVAEVAVFVHQDFRGQRLGTKLLATLLDEARRMGLRRVWGMTEPDNIPMLRLAVSFGFVRSEDDPSEFSLDLQAKPEAPGSGAQAAKPCKFCDLN